MQRAARGGTGEGVKQPQVHQLREAIPRYRTNPLPHYPQLARRRGLQGTVMLMVLVNRSGKVNDVRVFTSSGHRILDKSAVASVRKWQFEPATRGGKPVRMWVRVPIRFELK
jgi:protein TonB